MLLLIVRQVLFLQIQVLQQQQTYVIQMLYPHIQMLLPQAHVPELLPGHGGPLMIVETSVPVIKS